MTLDRVMKIIQYITYKLYNKADPSKKNMISLRMDTYLKYMVCRTGLKINVKSNECKQV